MDNLKAGFYPFIADYEKNGKLYRPKLKIGAYKIPPLPSKITKALMIQLRTQDIYIV